MSLRFTVLASGSAGNASLVEADGFGVLIDAGIGPRTLARRMAAVGVSWHQIQALVLTHTHSDHWKESTLVHLGRRGIPVYCHADHHATLTVASDAFPCLHDTGLVRFFEPGQEIQLSAGLRCVPLAVRHDCGATFGFRFEGGNNLFGPSSSLGYLADLGCWDGDLAQSMSEVDLLALEFNHDVWMERSSGRMPQLIARVLGDEGHLSNIQAAEFVREVVRRSTAGRLQHLVQLHLSRECNRPALAVAAARAVLEDAAWSGRIITACQDEPIDTLHLGGPAYRRRKLSPRRSARVSTAISVQPLLPGLESA